MDQGFAWLPASAFASTRWARMTFLAPQERFAKCQATAHKSVCNDYSWVT